MNMSSIEYPDVPIWVRISDQNRREMQTFYETSHRCRVTLIDGKTRNYPSITKAGEALGVGYEAIRNALNGVGPLAGRIEKL